MCAFHGLSITEDVSAYDSVTAECLPPLMVDNLEHDHRSNAEEDDKCEQDASTRPSEVIIVPEVILHVLSHCGAGIQVAGRAPRIVCTNHMSSKPVSKLS
jgi:hypothetical protein